MAQNSFCMHGSYQLCHGGPICRSQSWGKKKETMEKIVPLRWNNVLYLDEDKKHEGGGEKNDWENKDEESLHQCTPPSFF